MCMLANIHCCSRVNSLMASDIGNCEKIGRADCPKADLIS